MRRLLALGLLVHLGACALVGLFDPHGIADTGLYGHRMAHGEIPYRDFFVEFPPGALVALVLPALPGSHFVVWFKVFEFLCGAGCVALVAWLTRRLWPVLVAAVAPAVLGPIALNSFDYWPALLTVAALAALVARRLGLSWFLLGAAVATKLFPLLLVPVWLLRTGRRGLAWFFVALAVVVGPFLVLGAGGLRFSLRTQASRGLQIESLFGDALLCLDRLGAATAHVVVGKPYSLNVGGSTAHALALLSTPLVVAGAAVVWRRGAELYAATAACVLAFCVFGKVLSPQYLLWLVPLVPLVPSVAAWALFLAALALTHVEFPSHFKALTHGGAVAWLVLARNLLLVGLYAVLILRTSTARSTSTSRFRATRIQTAPPPA